MTKFIKMMEKINSKLKFYKQTIHVIEYGRSFMKMSNGLILNGKDKEKYLLKMRSKSKIWIKNSDKLLSNKITSKEISHQLAIERGKKCWYMHHEKIRKNLNTGIPWIKGKKGIKGHSQTEETKKKIGVKNSGINNGMYGHVWSNEHKKEMSLLMKQLIFDGKFTPNSNNRNTHWDAYYNGKKYRSSWEALYQYFAPLAEYEKLRIKYNIQNEEKVYIVDFIDYTNQIVAEIKPCELTDDKRFKAKWAALTKWANDNNFELLLIDRNWFIYNTKCPDNFNNFDHKTEKKIRKLYEINKKKRNN